MKRMTIILTVLLLSLFALNAMETIQIRGQSSDNSKTVSQSSAPKKLKQFGIQMGYGFDNSTISYKTTGTNESLKLKEGGFYFAFTGEFSSNKVTAFKMEFGMMTMGKATKILSQNGEKTTSKDSEATPANLNLYLGWEYNIDFKMFKLGIGAGVDYMSGKQQPGSKEAINRRIGLGFELTGEYAVTKKVAVSAGLKGAFYFFNLGNRSYSSILSLYDDFKHYAENYGGKAGLSQFGMKFFVGCTISNIPIKK